jgi:hypothetical protein
MSFFAEVGRVYGGACRFVWSLPAAALAVVGFEALQHAVEWGAGMYVGRAGFVAGIEAHDLLRLITGSMKVVWLLVLQFWVIRFIVAKSERWTVAPSRIAWRGFAVVLVFSSALALTAIWLPQMFQSGSPAQLGASKGAAVFQILTFPLGIALTPWLVGAAIGEAHIGPVSAVRRAWGSIWWGVGLTLIAVIPLMIPHYILGFAAVGRLPLIAIPMLVVDACLVGFLGVVIGATSVPIAERMAARSSAVRNGGSS